MIPRPMWAHSLPTLKFDPEKLIFYLGSFVVPALLVILNLVVRNIKGWKYTSGSDFLLMLMTVSFSFTALAKDVSPYMKNTDLQGSAAAVFLTLGFLILLGWYWTVSTVEVAIHDSIRENTNLAGVPQFKVFCAWTMVVLFTSLELVIFLVN